MKILLIKYQIVFQLAALAAGIVLLVQASQAASPQATDDKGRKQTPHVSILRVASIVVIASAAVGIALRLF